jgi:hypothetical protein
MSSSRNQIPPLLCVAAAAVTIIVAAVILLAMGRTLWGTPGQPGLWSGDIWSPLNSQLLADPYTFTHIIHGLGLYGLLWFVAGSLPVRVRGVLAVAMESGWEILENTNWVIQRYREATISLDYYGDSVINSTGDILAAALGFVLASWLPTRLSVVGFILLEIVLMIWIRDGFLLNILMLIYPIPEVRIWQAGQ